MLDTNVYFGENTKENTFRLFFNDYVIVIVITVTTKTILYWIKVKG